MYKRQAIKSHEEEKHRTSKKLGKAEDEVSRLQKSNREDRQQLERISDEARVVKAERDALQDEKRRYWEKLEETTRNLKVAHGAVKEKESELDRIKHEVSQHEEDKVVLKEKHEYVISEKNRKGEELRASKQELAALQLELNRAEEQFNKAIVGLESQKTELHLPPDIE